MEENDSLDNQTDEFDSKFNELNPGLAKTRKYFETNKDEILQRMLIEPGKNLEITNKLNTNLFCNNDLKNKNFGLNCNKRGKI